MKMELSPQQRNDQAAFRAFVEQEIIPYANRFDQEQSTPPNLIRRMAQEHYLGATVPQEWGGVAMGMLTYGLLHEEMGRGSSSIRSLLTVHGMVCSALLKWGSKRQKAQWLPKLASGEAIGAFALTEPNVGSDASSLESQARSQGDSYVLNGQKKWVSYGQVANLFLVFAQLEGKQCAFIVERDSPGLSIQPVWNLLGLRASMVAELHLQECCIPKDNLLGGVGFGFAYVAASALDFGRYTVAWGCVGILQACLEASIKYTNERRQFGVLLREHQLIRRMITDIIVDGQASRLLCCRAGYLKEATDPASFVETSMAKYFASSAAMKAAHDTVQIHGANGCGDDYPVQRYWRDAKVMEIIEGSTQIHQINIADWGYQNSLGL